MDLKQYRNAIVVHTYQLEKVVAARDKLNRRIEQLADYIHSNASFLPAEERAKRTEKADKLIAGPAGFTDSVRNLLRDKPERWVNAIGVRSLLVESSFNLSQYSNPLASIHTILKRLAKAGEVDTEIRDGELFYRWKMNIAERILAGSK